MVVSPRAGQQGGTPGAGVGPPIASMLRSVDRVEVDEDWHPELEHMYDNTYWLLPRSAVMERNEREADKEETAEKANRK